MVRLTSVKPEGSPNLIYPLWLSARYAYGVFYELNCCWLRREFGFAVLINKSIMSRHGIGCLYKTVPDVM